MHEDLLGYLLGALSADEQRRIENALAVDPQLQRELEQLRLSLEPLDSLQDETDPPSGLANRTLRAIERFDEARRPTPRNVARSRATDSEFVSPDRRSASTRRYSYSDGIVLALVGLAAITLFLPALVNSRYAARKVACQDNMRSIGGLLIDDSFRHGGMFIPVPLTGKHAFAGIFASQLLEQKRIPADTSTLLCPGTPWREDVDSWSVPTLEQIDNATGAELDRLQQLAGGSYAYAIGYVDDRGRYRPIRNRSRPFFPILADVPSPHLEDRQSANHGGRGQNLFFEDGHITFVTELKHFVGDDPIRNRLGVREYGLDREDAVLLPSHMSPILQGTKPARTLICEPRR